MGIMAVRKAIQTGNWSAAGTWDTPPVDGDTAHSNGLTVTIDEVVNQPNTILTNAVGSGIVAGGAFVLGGDFNVTTAGVTNGHGTATFTVNTTRTATLALGVCQSATGIAVSVTTGSASSNLTFSGCTFIGGSANNMRGLTIDQTVTITFTNCTAQGGTGATGSSGVGVIANAPTLTGTLHLLNIAGCVSRALQVLAGSPTLTLTGDVTHRSASVTCDMTTGTLTYTALSEEITGELISSSTAGLWFVGSGSITLNRPSGSLQMHNGNAGPSYLYKNAASGVIVCNGDVTCGTGGATYVARDAAEGSGSITIDGTVTGPLAGGNLTGFIAVTGGKVVVRHIARNPTSGQRPSEQGPICYMADTTITATTDTSTVTLVPSGATGDPPSQADVRDGVAYHFDTLEGTLKVPTPGQVLVNVPTDNTVGTFELTISEILAAWDASVAPIVAEMEKIPRATAAVTAGGSVRRSIGSRHIDETITGDTPV
jgi:hypothetical protein